MAAKKKSSKKKTGKSGAKTAKKAPTSKMKAPAALAKKAAPAKKKTSAPKKKASAAKKKTSAAPKKKAAPAQKKAAAPKKAAAAPRKAAAPTSNGPTSRRDATGHLNPEYARKLREASNEFRDDDTDTAFIRTARSHDTLAEELGEDAVSTMTSGEDQSERLQDEQVEEENGGPFITTSPREEYAVGTDASNPSDATREPFPKT